MNERTQRIILVMAAAILLAPRPALAESEFGRSGPYLRGGVAAAWDVTDLIIDVDQGIGLGIALGQRVNSWLALEAQYHWLGNSTIEGTSAEVTRWDTTANLKVSTAWRFQPYALVGIGYGNYEASGGSGSISAGGFVTRLGAGFDIYITRNIAVYAEGMYVIATGDISELDYATLGAGAMFRF